MEALIIFVIQLLFSCTRTLSTRYVVRDKVIHTAIITLIIQSLWLVSTSMGVKAVFEMNYIVISSYLVGGLIGSIIAMKIKI